MSFTDRVFTPDKTPPVESPGRDKLGLAVFLRTSAPKLITRARTHAHNRHQTAIRHSLQAYTHIISCESSLIELTPQLRARFTRFRSKMEDRGWNKCWASLIKEANAATLFCHYETTGSRPPVPSVHSGLGEIEEHYLFIFIHSSSQLIPRPSIFSSLIRRSPATYFLVFI